MNLVISIMAQYSISPATAEDLPNIAAISLDAFTSNPRTMSYWMLRDAEREDLLAWRLHRVTHDFHHDINAMYHKVVDTKNGAIMAHAVWETPRHPESKEKGEERKRIEEDFKRNEAVPKGVNRVMQEEFKKCTKDMREKYVDSTKDYGKHGRTPQHSNPDKNMYII